VVIAVRHFWGVGRSGLDMATAGQAARKVGAYANLAWDDFFNEVSDSRR
jgi:hypothetical protein